uniref:hypothetical protein n=1 Tax=Marinobacterium profundum TaxID=1714300 RepID=UPI001C1F9FFF
MRILQVKDPWLLSLARTKNVTRQQDATQAIMRLQKIISRRPLLTRWTNRFPSYLSVTPEKLAQVH